MIKIDVNIREEEDWQEGTAYIEESSYQLFTKEIKCKDAEANWQIEGNHFAYIQSEGEQQEVIALTDGKSS